MKRSEIDKSDIDLVYGLSCIENYILSHLNRSGINISYLYYKSYLSFSEILKNVIIKDVEYAYFNAVPRIFRIAKKDGILSYQWVHGEKLEKLMTMDEHILIRVKPDFMMQRFNIKTWRDDHFFMVKSVIDGGVVYINDNPRIEETISNRELELLYANSAFVFHLIEPFKAFPAVKLIEEFFSDIAKTNDLFNSWDALNCCRLSQIRDAIGILKILRNRNDKFLSNYMMLPLFKNLLSKASELYNIIEYMRLRKRDDREELIEKIKCLFQIDMEITDKLSTNIGEYIYDKCKRSRGGSC